MHFRYPTHSPMASGVAVGCSCRGRAVLLGVVGVAQRLGQQPSDVHIIWYTHHGQPAQDLAAHRARALVPPQARRLGRRHPRLAASCPADCPNIGTVTPTNTPWTYSQTHCSPNSTPLHNHELSRPGFVGGYDALASGLIIVWSCPISQSFSYSAGGIFPQAEWSLSLLYQDTHSAVATVTSPASCHGPSRLISSFLYREFTASAAALS